MNSAGSAQQPWQIKLFLVRTLTCRTQPKLDHFDCDAYLSFLNPNLVQNEAWTWTSTVNDRPLAALDWLLWSIGFFPGLRGWHGWGDRQDIPIA